MENANGVIKKLTSAERSYYTAAEVREMMGVSRDTAYRMIRSLRSDLIADGQLAKGYPSGKIPKKAFNKLYMLDVYRIYCSKLSEKDKRRYKIIKALYISKTPMTIAEISKKFSVSKVTVYEDIKIAKERLSSLFFGIDGLKFF